MANDDQALTVVGTRPLPATKANIDTMDRFIQVMDPTSPPKLRWALAVVAVRLGLHPLNNEVMLYEGQVFITVHGRRRLAERNGDLAAIQPDIVIDEQHRKALGATTKGDVVAECRVYRRSDERPTIQYGLVRAHERWPSEKEMDALGVKPEDVQKLRNNDDPDGLFALIKNTRAKVRPVILQPQIMAMKRAEARALDALAGVPLPTFDPEMGAPITNGALPQWLMQADAEQPAISSPAETSPTPPPAPSPTPATSTSPPPTPTLPPPPIDQDPGPGGEPPAARDPTPVEDLSLAELNRRAHGRQTGLTPQEGAPNAQ